MGTTFFCKANCNGISLRVGSMLEAFLKSQNHKMNAQLNLKWIKNIQKIVRSHFKVISLSLSGYICVYVVPMNVCMCASLSDLDMSVFMLCTCKCAHVHPYQFFIFSIIFVLFFFFHFEIGSLTESGFHKSS